MGIQVLLLSLTGHGQGEGGEEFGPEHVPQSRNWRLSGARLALCRRALWNCEARRREEDAKGGSRALTHLFHSLPRELQLFPTRRGERVEEVTL